ncbi:MAG: hypothetical protein E4G74_02440 [Erysipelotrichales bacterium]|nr:MAG: hypothetical protein E4G74_02440 [Erysipelotrichales bacterium]
MSPNNYRIPPQVQGEGIDDIDAMLALSLETGKLVMIFTNDEIYTEFSAGIVSTISEFWFILKRVDINGRADGFACIPMDIVFRAEIDTLLINRIAMLWKMQEEEHRTLPEQELDLMRGFLESARQLQSVVSLEILDSRRNDLTGFVQHIDDSFVKIGLLDFSGNPSGTSLVSIDSITQAVMESASEKTLHRLFDYNQRIGNLT